MADEQYGLVMPFVCTTSQGGIYDDSAFVAGYRCGLVDAELSQQPKRYEITAEPALGAQLDLLAMRHDYVLVVDETTPDWYHLTFHRKPPFDLFERDELDDLMNGLTDG